MPFTDEEQIPQQKKSIGKKNTLCIAIALYISSLFVNVECTITNCTKGIDAMLEGGGAMHGWQIRC